jgi:hypothetical protein
MIYILLAYTTFSYIVREERIHQQQNDQRRLYDGGQPILKIFPTLDSPARLHVTLLAAAVYRHVSSSARSM